MSSSSLTILGKYNILERISAGSHGRLNIVSHRTSHGWTMWIAGLVYRVSTLAGGDKPEEYAVKLERASRNPKRNRLPSDHEYNVLRALAHVDASNPSPCIPRAIDFGYDKPSHSKVLVLDLLGTDLQCVLRDCGKSRFTMKNTMLIAIQLVRTSGSRFRVKVESLDLNSNRSPQSNIYTQRISYTEISNLRTFSWAHMAIKTALITIQGNGMILFVATHSSSYTVATYCCI
jgi:hypothetical protein